MTEKPLAIICFAVKEEARFFKAQPDSRFQIKILLTGMGARNAENAIRAVLSERKPALILSCGFAGGLRPDLARGTIVFKVYSETNLHSKLLSSGAVPALFHCAESVATTAHEKQALRQNTGADAVDMESDVICSACQASNIPSGTVRIILDTANEDLPLDFNRLMTADQRLDFGKVALALLRTPWKIPALLQLQAQSSAAARKLAVVLNEVLHG